MRWAWTGSGKIQVALGWLHDPRAAWIILVLSLSLTAAAWQVSSEAYERRIEEQFQARARETAHAIEQRMAQYESLLRGGVGLFAPGAPISRADWSAYVAALDTERRFPGIQGIGVARWVRAAERAEFIASMRASGSPQFEISPPGERDEYHSIIYLEPRAGRNLRAFGFDMGSEPIRRAAIDRARDSGVPALSGRVTLVQETGVDIQHGFLLYAPVYRAGLPSATVAERRAAYWGTVYSAFRVADLMHGVLGPAAGDVDYEIFDGEKVGSERLLIDSRWEHGLVQDSDFAALEQLDQLSIAGRTWTVRLRVGPAFQPLAQAEGPLLIALGGGLVDLLLFLTIAQLARLHERADRLAEERTVELRAANAELVQQKRELELINTELEQFAYVASHDLQEPLRMVSSYTQLLARRYRGRLDADADVFISYAVQGAARMHALIRDLLAYAHVGSRELENTTVPLERPLDAALQLLHLAIAERSATVTRDPLPRVLGDESQLAQLFQNLLDNAIKFGGEPPLVHVSAERRGERWRIQIQDNGIGIPPEQQSRIWALFTRLHDRERFPGTGIGLAICKKIAQRHGGEIGVQSAVGKGSAFHFTLAAADPD
jgi:signal transduction histidine kinase